MILLPCSRWAGVSGSRSSSSDETKVSGRSFNTASISTMIVSKVDSDTCRLPRTFLIAADGLHSKVRPMLTCIATVSALVSLLE